jgi:SAM-dependent methyltransferase
VPALQAGQNAARCRACGHPLNVTFCDLGATPLANAMLRNETEAETFYPLHALVCDQCMLVQLIQYNTPAEIFSEYTYFSSYSQSWLAHAKDYSAKVTGRFELGKGSFIVELASNDGYLLKNFVAAGIPCLGVEPAENVAEAASAIGVPTLVEFFSENLARRLVADGKQADLLVANNVLAHVPDLNDFVAGIKTLLKNRGIATFEFPHLLNLIRNVQFDTIYHEHFNYFSLLSLQRVFARHELRIFDLEKLATHGGSLRVFACHDTDPRGVMPVVPEVIDEEREFGLADLATYRAFGAQARRVKLNLIRFFVDAVSAGARIACYGAAAKGNTLLNYCGIGKDHISFAVDRNPHKQGRLLPGTRIPVFDPDHVAVERPEYLLILAWNLKEEVMTQMKHIRDWGGRFVIPIPDVEIIS